MTFLPGCLSCRGTVARRGHPAVSKELGDFKTLGGKSSLSYQRGGFKLSGEVSRDRPWGAAGGPSANPLLIKEDRWLQVYDCTWATNRDPVCLSLGTGDGWWNDAPSVSSDWLHFPANFSHGFRVWVTSLLFVFIYGPHYSEKKKKTAHKLNFFSRLAKLSICRTVKNCVRGPKVVLMEVLWTFGLCRMCSLTELSVPKF